MRHFLAHLHLFTVIVMNYGFYLIGCPLVLGNALKSPGYPKTYPNNMDCIYNIPISQGMALKIYFHDFHLQVYGKQCRLVKNMTIILLLQAIQRRCYKALVSLNVAWALVSWCLVTWQARVSLVRALHLKWNLL